ncbi:hypothetical protein BDW22DRAFT_1190123 [Trametopsis cervina]|nr:hypothetical protein BDW22DRAFT_1190123 [Trametopsis cervina]
MACNPTPTSTQFATVASTSTLTTVTQTIVTRPPAVTTIETQSCSDRVLGPGRTSCVEKDVTTVSTIDTGAITTEQVPIVIVFQITQASPTKTLFASCSSQDNGQTVITSDTPSSMSSPDPSSSISLITTTVTPAPTVFTTESISTFPDGHVVTETSTITSTFAPLPIVIPAVPTGNPTPGNNATPAPTSPSVIGAIVGGALGGFFGLIGIVFLIWWLWKRRRKFLPPSLVSEKSSMHNLPRLPPGYVVEPQQYQYGVVGSRDSHGSSPPRSLYARSSQSHSHAHSAGHGGTPGQSSSQRLSSVRHSSTPTPPFFAGTSILPGPSAAPSSSNLHGLSRPATPGASNTLQNPPPSSFPARPAWSGYGSGTDDDLSSEGHGSITFLAQKPRSRRHSPTVERRSRPRSSEGKSPPPAFEMRSPVVTDGRGPPTFERKGPPPRSRQSFSGTIEIERPVRPDVLRRRSTDATPVYEEPRSPLFVVNHTEEPSSGSDTDLPGQDK